ncbi:MAG: rhodanese-like domain-containing protein [Pseudomonadota bacterium]
MPLINACRRVAVAGLCLLLAGGPVAASAQGLIEFPGRSLYDRFGVQAIDLFDLRGQLSRFTVIDVRPRFEYDILHIEGAHHVDLHAPDFLDQVRELEREFGGPLVFYCNGRQSYLSYRAVARVNEQDDIGPAQAFDAGILDWAERYPSHTLLWGTSLDVSDESLISDEEFQARLLDAQAFAERVRENPDAVVLDIRSPAERDEISLFTGREQAVPLTEMDRLDATLRAVQDAGQSLLIFDQHGQQVRWLQYHLEERGIQDYHFLDGGLQGFYDEVMMR